MCWRKAPDDGVIRNFFSIKRCNPMTELLEQAITKVKKLSNVEQDAIAALIFEELEDEARWDETFEKSQDVLARLAEEALAEERAGNIQELDPGKL